MLNFLKNSGKAFFLNSAGLGLGFLLQLLLARALDLQDFGDYYYVLAWINILLLISKAGLDSSSKKFLPGYLVSGEYSKISGFIAFSNRLSLAVSAVVILIVAVAVYLSGARAGLALTFYFALPVLLFNALLHINSAHLQALKDVFQGLFSLQVLRPLLMLLIVGMLFIAGKSIPAAGVMEVNVLSTVSALLVVLFVLYRKQEVKKAGEKEFQAKEWMLVALPLLLNAGIHVVMAQADVIVLGIFIDTETSGIYSTASRVAQLCGFGLTAINIVAAPLISEYHASGDRKSMKKLLFRVAAGGFCFAVLVAVVLYLGGELVLGIFDEPFKAGYLPMLIIVAGYLFNTLFGAVSFLLMLTGYHNETLKIMGSAAAINILLNIVLVYNLGWGMQGAAAATLISMIYWNVYMYIFARRKLKLDSSILSFLSHNE